MTAVELDPDLAARLAGRLAGTNVAVIRGDGARLPLVSGQCSAVVSCTMLHHLPDAALQDALFRESRRVLRPAGVFIGTDGTDTAARRDLHQEDILVPLDPARLPERLRAAGFRDVCVASDGDRFRFSGVGLRFRPHIHVESRVCRSTHWWTDAEGARNKQPGEGHAVHGPCSGQQGV